MKILLLTHIYPPATDGGSKLISKLAEYLDQKNNQITVMTTNAFSTDDFIRPKALKINTSISSIFRLPIYYLHHRLPKPIFRLTAFVRTIRKIDRPEIIISGPFPTFINIYALFLKFFYHSKLVFIPCFHQGDPDFSRYYLIFCLKQADLVCTLSNYEKELLNDQHGIPSQKIFTLHGGVDQSFITTQPLHAQPPRLLYLGSFAAHKESNYCWHLLS